MSKIKSNTMLEKQMFSWEPPSLRYTRRVLEKSLYFCIQGREKCLEKITRFVASRIVLYKDVSVLRESRTSDLKDTWHG